MNLKTEKTKTEQDLSWVTICKPPDLNNEIVFFFEGTNIFSITKLVFVFCFLNKG